MVCLMNLGVFYQRSFRKEMINGGRNLPWFSVSLTVDTSIFLYNAASGFQWMNEWSIHLWFLLLNECGFHWSLCLLTITLLNQWQWGHFLSLRCFSVFPMQLLFEFAETGKGKCKLERDKVVPLLWKSSVLDWSHKWTEIRNLFLLLHPNY